MLLCISYVFYLTPYRIKGEDAGKVNEATQYSRSMDYFLKNKFKTENRVLIDLPEWGRECPAATKNPEESEVNYILLCFSSEFVLDNKYVGFCHCNSRKMEGKYTIQQHQNLQNDHSISLKQFQ